MLRDSSVPSFCFICKGKGGRLQITASDSYAQDGRGGDITLNTPACFGENSRPAPRNTNPDTHNDDSRIIEADFRDVGIRSKTQTYSLNFRQPITRTPTSEFALGLGLDLRRSQTYILDDVSFSFTEGPEDGEAKVTVMRFEDYVALDRTNQADVP